MGSWGASATGAPPVGRLEVATRFSFEKGDWLSKKPQLRIPQKSNKQPKELLHSTVSYSRAPKVLVGLKDNDKSQSKGAKIRSNSHYCSASATKAAQVRLRNIGSRCYKMIFKVSWTRNKLWSKSPSTFEFTLKLLGPTSRHYHNVQVRWW